MLRLLIVLCVAITRVFGGSAHNGTFLYFSYGSNLLRARLQINIKTAHYIANASLSGWRLDFNTTVKYWNGAVATIAKQPDSVVWGDVWLIGIQDLEHLDEQEGVKRGLYHAINVTVDSTSLGPLTVRTYVEYNTPAFVEPENLPLERHPSETYYKVILYGAMESHLPVSYLKYLKRFPNNGKSASKSQLKKLGYPFCDESNCG